VLAHLGIVVDHEDFFHASKLAAKARDVKRTARRTLADWPMSGRPVLWHIGP